MRTKKITDGQSEPQGPSFIEAARRAQIIEAAIAAIAEVGYAKASLAEMAKRAGVSKGVISYYFSSKAELIEQAVVHIYTLGASEMIPEVMSQPTPPDMLRRLIVLNVEFVASHASYMRVLMDVFANFRDENGELHFSMDDAEIQIEGISELLKHGQEQGYFRPFDTWIMAVAIRAAIDQVVARLVAFPDTDPDAYARELSEAFVRAALADPTP